MREKYREDKEYPENIRFNIGDIFSRCPKEIHFNRVSGTFPIYGRSVLDTERVSEHKLLVTLGEVASDNLKTEVSDEVVVAIYGELDKFVFYDVEDEFSKLWLES